MKFWTLLTTGALLGATFASAQALRDKVIVELPYRVVLNEKTTLEPGQYTLNQLSDSGGGRYVLQIRKDDIEHQALVTSIPATQNNTQEDTRVMLHKLSDGSYRFDKIWVQGKDYGYEFPLPDAIRNREREMQSSSIVARYDAGSDATQEGQPAPVIATEQRTATAEAQAAETPVTQPVETQVAQAPQPAPQPEPEPQQTPLPAARGEDVVGDEELPQTASHWFTMLTAGLAMVGGGLALRRGR